MTPDPRAVDAAVVLDLPNRVATVMPAETGFNAMLWRTGIEKMGPGGYGAPTVWAHGVGRERIAHGRPEGGALRFQFRKGDASWPELVATAGLAATVVLDRETQTIMSARFRGRKAV